MDKTSENEENQNINDKNKCMVIDNEDPEVYWNSAVLIIAIILLGILMYWKIHNSTNCVTNYGSLGGTIDSISIINSINI
jgi:hypothetical protein